MNIKRISVAICFSIFSLLSGCSQAPIKNDNTAPPPQTVGEYKSKITLKDDSLDVHAFFETINAVSEGSWESYLTAGVSKKDGTTLYFLTQKTYQSNARFEVAINYETDDGPKSEQVKTRSKFLGCTRYGCTYVELISLPINEKEFDGYADKYLKNNSGRWNYKIPNGRGGEYKGSIPYVEMYALREKVAEYRAARGIGKAR